MSQKNAGALKTTLAALLGIGANDGNNSLLLYTFLNWAGRRIWNKYDWPDRKGDTTFTTVEPYTTGTCTFTNNSTGITFSGATLTAAMTGRKITTGLGNALYTLASVNTGAGTAVLDRVFNETTVAGSAFVIYEDEYDLATGVVGAINDVRLHAPGTRGHIDGVPLRMLDDGQFLPRAMGPPKLFAPAVRTTSKVHRIRLWPIPNTTYWVQYRYSTEWVNLDDDADVPVTPEDLEELLIKVALQMGAYYADGKTGPNDTEVEALIRLWFASNPEQMPRVGKREGMDSANVRSVTLDLSRLISS